ncbi:MAG: C-GCAxxG-C-C family (seleno)protein, partial [Pygmaiobacter sp.]
MLKERAKQFYLGENRNCAEAILLAANEAYALGLDPESIKLVGGFGGGMGCGSVCGALSGAIAALGKRNIATTAHETAGFQDTCAELVSRFRQELGALDCTELTVRYKKDTTRCLAVVERAAELLEEFCKEEGFAAQPREECCKEERSAAQPPLVLEPKAIQSVKALGFLQCKGTTDFNGRVITRNGKLTSAETRCITEAAERFGNGEIAMTTRLTIEIQSVPYANIEPLRAYLAEQGLETGGTGNKVRPVVSCK